MKCYALVMLAGCSWTGVQGSGNAKSEVRNVPAFSAVDIAGPIDAEISVGAESHVEITGDDNILPLITSDIRGDSLSIGARKNVRPSVRLVAKITAPRLTGVALTGSGDIAVRGVQADHLAVHLTGSGTIRADGTAHEVEVDLTGSGNVALDHLTAERASVSVSGSGDVAVAASKALDVGITGSGDVTYHGDPEVKQRITGSGHVAKK
jgi:hypothetical protein